MAPGASVPGTPQVIDGPPAHSLCPCAGHDERITALTGFLHTYSHHRCHTALGGHPPISRASGDRAR
ncbi:hypothetical protein GCM10023335_80890 [Streptomyces siamensis]|uniref:Integrase catalytic domain-containing protein n=1 Tax=Streptomyces siamensis TaxID=1274986 RepID=A0ABP9JMN6_9ACTN